LRARYFNRLVISRMSTQISTHIAAGPEQRSQE
jgi:hypothetical protein